MSPDLRLEAAALSLLHHVVEMDYALGWALAGIYAHPDRSLLAT